MTGGGFVTVRHYLSYSSFLKKRFHAPVARIPLNAGFSCPNRDGTISVDGCAFCDNRAFSPVAEATLPPIDQLFRSMTRLKKRYGVFIAYLQPFSNTYAPVERLKKVCEPLIAVPGVAGLAVGTRPDCIGPEVLEYLADLASRTYLCVELGLQSSHDETLLLINRGHTFDDFTAAVTRLSGRGIETVAHVVLGLPGETETMMFETASRLASLTVTGVKIHQLMIIKGTAIEKMHLAGKVRPLDLSEYAPLLCGFLERLRPDQHIHRIMSDTKPENGLVAPLWSADKNGTIAYLQSFMEKNGVMQGSRWG